MESQKTYVLDDTGLSIYDEEIKSFIDGKVSPITTDVENLETTLSEHSAALSNFENSLKQKVEKIDGKGLSTNDYTTPEKTKLASIESGAQVNQNAFSSIAIGSSSIVAGVVNDILHLIAGENVTIKMDTANKTITIAARDTVYTHPTSSVAAGTYKVVTVDRNGHVVNASNPTNMADYNITDSVSIDKDGTVAVSLS